ncbi:reverse transcriptase domain-containing protein, partial [Tanacetum coccineum]
ERFPSGRYGKLQDRADGPFRVLRRINDNAYKIDLPGNYGVSATFNVADLAPYTDDDVFGGDSGTSRFLGGEDDTDRHHNTGPFSIKRVSAFSLSYSVGREAPDDPATWLAKCSSPLGFSPRLSFSYESLSSGIQSQKDLTMSAEPDPRDVEIERLRNRIRELEINPFNRYEQQFENTPSQSQLSGTSDDEFNNFFHNQHPPPSPGHRRRRAPPPPQQPADPLRSLGLRTEIPEFEGNLQPDDFLDWLLTVERIFDLRDIPDNLKVKLVAIKLKKYASLWWENIQKQRHRDGKHKVASWDKMKRLLRAKFLPVTFKQDAYIEYHNLSHGTLSVTALITEFERMRLRCGADEDEEQLIARFLGILRPDIADTVSLMQYYSFSDVCRLALRVEQQNTRRGKTVARFQPSSRNPTQPQISNRTGPVKTDTPTAPTTANDNSAPLRCFDQHLQFFLFLALIRGSGYEVKV